MGYITTVVINNDALHLIEEDSDFGKRLAAAACEAPLGGPVSLIARGERAISTAGEVVETHHSSQAEFVMAQHGGGRRFRDIPEEERLTWLRFWAGEMGYSLRKKAKRGRGGSS